MDGPAWRGDPGAGAYCRHLAEDIGTLPDLGKTRRDSWPKQQMNIAGVVLWIALAIAFVPCLATAEEPQRAIALSQLRSGKEFVSAETRAQQDDLAVIPGMLWVEQGEQLWREDAGPAGQSCASCHGEPSNLAGVAARYPAYDWDAQKLLNLEGKIQQCRVERQMASPFSYESQALLALTALVAHQSRGLAMHIDIGGLARPFFEAGRTLYYEQQGQLNISCAQCHEQSWGKRLRTGASARGIPTAFRPTVSNGRLSVRCTGGFAPVSKAFGPSRSRREAPSWWRLNFI
jgi:L-cysteine S-thiosulfotransferase